MKSQEMWLEFYECIHKKHGTVHVVCKYCHKPYIHPNKIGKHLEGKSISNGATTSMSRHLRECAAYRKQKPPSQSFISEFMQNDTTNSGHDDILNKVLKFFISGNIAFNQVDNPYFQELIQTAHVKVKGLTVNHKSIRERLRKLAATAKEDLMIALMENNSKISLALDCWSSKSGYAFLGKL